MQNTCTRKMVKGLMFVSISLGGCSKSNGKLGIEERTKVSILDKNLTEESVQSSTSTMVKVDLEAQGKECLDNKMSVEPSIKITAVEPSLKKTAEEETTGIGQKAILFPLCGVVIGVLGGAIMGGLYPDNWAARRPPNVNDAIFFGASSGFIGGFFVGSIVGIVVDRIKKKRRIETGWKDRHVIYQVL